MTSEQQRYCKCFKDERDFSTYRIAENLIHLAYIANVISNDNATVLKACVKHTPADVNCYCKMTSVVSLDEVTSFLSERRNKYM